MWTGQRDQHRNPRLRRQSLNSTTIRANHAFRNNAQTGEGRREEFGVASQRGRWSALRGVKTANQQKTVIRNSADRLEGCSQGCGCQAFYFLAPPDPRPIFWL